MSKKYTIDPTRAYCKKCKAKYDLPTLRESEDYKPGVCPSCGGFLFSIKEYIHSFSKNKMKGDKNEET